MCALPRPLNPTTATLTVLFGLCSALALRATGSAIDDMRKCLRLTLSMVSPPLKRACGNDEKRERFYRNAGGGGHRTIAKQTLGDRAADVKLVDARSRR